VDTLTLRLTPSLGRAHWKADMPDLPLDPDKTMSEKAVTLEGTIASDVWPRIHSGFSFGSSQSKVSKVRSHAHDHAIFRVGENERRDFIL
jgi:hypothetical protein